VNDSLAMPPEMLSARITRLGGSLGAAGQRVAHFIVQNPAAALASSAMDLAASTGTSDATVIRTVQALGYAGLADLKQALVASLERGYWWRIPAPPGRNIDSGQDCHLQ
jgi:DNA-binding MurR/RpiR family transcriptional regulator